MFHHVFTTADYRFDLCQVARHWGREVRTQGEEKLSFVREGGGGGRREGERQRDRQTQRERETDRQTDRQTDRHRQRSSQRRTDK